MEEEQKSNGALVGLVIIIIILVIGGIYIWISNKNAEPVQNPQAQSENTLSSQDAATLDSLQQDSSALDTSTGVDASKVK